MDAFTWLLQSDWAERVGWSLLHSLWQIALIAGLYAIASSWFRNGLATARYAMGCVALLAMVCFPMGTYFTLSHEKTVSELADVGETEVVKAFPTETTTPRNIDIAFQLSDSLPNSAAEEASFPPVETAVADKNSVGEVGSSEDYDSAKTVRSDPEESEIFLDEQEEGALPRPGDFYLCFYLEAKDNPNSQTLLFANEEESFPAEPFPCLTEESVLSAEVAEDSNSQTSRIDVTLSPGGAKIFARITREHVGKRLAIVIDGKVASAPVIRSPILGSKALIEGDFSRKEAQAIADKLNAYRKKAGEFLQAIEKEESKADETGEPVGREDPQGGKSDRANPSNARWGKAVDGVQVRLANAKPILGRSDWPHPVLRLRYDARNEGRYTLHLPHNGLCHQLEVDGQWYEWVDPRIAKMHGDPIFSGGSVLLDFESGRLHSGNEVKIAGDWRAIPKGKETQYAARQHSGGGFMIRTADYGKELVLTPGRHQVRVAVVCPSARAPFHGVVRAASEALLVEIDALSTKVVPGAGATLNIGSRTRLAKQFHWVVACNQSVVTDDQGRFRAEKLPPGLAQVSHVIEVPGKEGSSFRPVQFVEIASGKPTPFVFGGRGRPVEGKLVGDGSFKDVRIRIAPNAPHPGSLADQQDPTWPAYGQFLTSPAGKNYVKGNTQVNADGTFRMDNVPPESYQLFVTITDHSGRAKNIGYAEFTIKTIPDGASDEPYDIGEIRVRRPDDAKTGAPQDKSVRETTKGSAKDGKPRVKTVIDPPFGIYVAADAPVAVAELTLQGTVVDNKTGKPVVGASIEWGDHYWGDHYAKAADRERTSTDARGRYVLRAAKGGLDYRLGIHASGYAPRWLDLGLLDPTKSHVHDFELAPGHRAYGVVTDRQKRPVPGAIVTARTAATGRGFARYSRSPPPVTGFPGPPRRATTDATGRFEIVDLPDGQVALSCSAKHRYARGGNYAVDEPVEFAMSRSGEPGVIQVRVIDAESNQTIPAFHITRRYDPTWYAVTNSDGQFRFPSERTRDLPYSVYVYAKGYAPADASVPAVADNSDEFFTARLTRAPAFVGQLVDAASGRPIAKARIMCAVTESASYFVWAAFDEYRDGFHYGGLSWVQRAVTGDDGMFAFAEGSKATKGDLFILADGYQRTILRAADRAKANPQEPVVVGLQPQSILSGVLTRTGHPLSNVVIRLENQLPSPRRQLREYFEAVRTDAQGRFRFEKMAPGAYAVSADSPSFRLERRVQVGSGGEATVEFNADLGPHTLSGKALPGAEITLGRKFEWGYRSFRTTVDGTGNYRFEGLQAGEYSVRLFRRATVTDFPLDISYPPITVRGDEQRDLTQVPRK